MQLVINTFGASLRKNGQLFEILSGEQKHKISPAKVNSILITVGVHISSDAIFLAMQNNIEIFILDKFGNPVGRFWHARMGSTVRIRRAQLQLSSDSIGLPFALRWVEGKLHNQIDFFTRLRSRRTRISVDLTKAIEALRQALEQMKKLSGPVGPLRNQILGIEGSAGKVYWEIWPRLLPEQFKFNGRSKRPAKDEFNALLNYAYGVLYGITEKAVILAGMDPYIGFIHTDNYNKVSLVFDIIENYRIWAEECILNLFSKKKIQKSHFEKLSNGFYLGDEGKKVFMPFFNEFLDEQIRHNKRNVRRRDCLQLDMHAYAQDLLKAMGDDKKEGIEA